MPFHVMIVDDCPAMRTFIMRVIDLSGLEIGKRLQASNGQEALDTLREQQVDLILTDINMPIMNGEELLRQLDQDELLKTIPVLVVSTDGSEHRIQCMLSLNARGHLKKPFSPEALREKLKELLGVPMPMNKDAVRQILTASGRQALETMFFEIADAASSETQRPNGDLVATSLTFTGEPPGRFGIVLSEPVARSIAANFLALEDENELTPNQIRDVAGEFTNIVCGSVLSDLESKFNFDLSSPVAIHIAVDDPPPACCEQSPIACRFELSGGSIVLCLAFEEAT
jgi:two-component system chemotaxis response regulator CheY